MKNLLGPLIVYGRVIHDECVTDYKCSACSTYTTSQPLVLEDVNNVLPKWYAIAVFQSAFLDGRSVVYQPSEGRQWSWWKCRNRYFRITNVHRYTDIQKVFSRYQVKVLCYLWKIVLCLLVLVCHYSVF